MLLVLTIFRRVIWKTSLQAWSFALWILDALPLRILTKLMLFTMRRHSREFRLALTTLSEPIKKISRIRFHYFKMLFLQKSLSLFSHLLRRCTETRSFILFRRQHAQTRYLRTRFRNLVVSTTVRSSTNSSEFPSSH